MLPEPETLPEPDVLPEPEPESEPLDVEPPVIDPDDELEPVPVALDDDEPEGARERDVVVPESDALPEPESILPVAAPPLGPLSFTCAWQPAKARAPAKTGIASSLFFISTSSAYSRVVGESVNAGENLTPINGPIGRGFRFEYPGLAVNAIRSVGGVFQ
jgi:hypothetical protein